MTRPAVTCPISWRSNNRRATHRPARAALRATLACAVLLCSAAGGDRLAAQGSTLDVAHVVINGDSIAVHDAGSGAPVVVVPGLLGSAHSFRQVVPALTAAGRRVVVVDLLGTGRSARPRNGDYSLEAQAARVAGVMQHHGLRASTLLCHSVGASVCYRLALSRPELVARVISVNGGPDERAATAGLRSAMRFAPLIRLFGSSGTLRNKLRDGLVDSAGDPAWVTDEIIAAYTAPFGDLDTTLRTLQGMTRARDTVPLAPRLSRLQVPIHLLVGTGSRDDAISAADMAVLQRIPRLTIDSIAGAGQYIQEENPSAVVRAVLGTRKP